MKTLLVVLRWYSLQLIGGLAMFAGAVWFWRTYVPTPSKMPYEPMSDMLYPWFPIAIGLIGLWLILSAWSKGARLRRGL